MIYFLSSIFAQDQVFSALLKGANPDATLSPPEDLPLVLKSSQPGDILYVELGKDLEVAKKVVRNLAKLNDKGWAVLDPWGIIDDVGALFHTGALDYLGPKMRQLPLSKPRMTAMRNWSGFVPVSNTNKAPSFEPGKAKIGNEYSFVFLLVECADQAAMKRNLGEKRLPDFRAAFLEILHTIVGESGGILWMQQEYTFLAAYPDTALGSAVSMGLKLVLSRALLSLESLGLRDVLSFRVALHRGTAPWQNPGETGNVISDAVNSLFHLGQKRAKKNTLSLTEACLADFPPRLAPYLMEDGVYEGRKIYRLPEFQP